MKTTLLVLAAGACLWMAPLWADSAASSSAVVLALERRAMDGWLRVDAEAVQAEDELERWVAVGVAYARLLPPKS